MSTKTFRAATMREALERVRRELGGDAVIIGTRERRRLLGRGRPYVEVRATAAGPVAQTRGGRWHSESLRIDPGEALASTAALHAQVGEQLGQLHAMVSQLANRGHIDHLVPDLPVPLVPLYAALVDADVPELLARRLVRQAADALDPSEPPQPDELRFALHAALADSLPIAPPIAALRGVRRVVALVGPTGVGKTTTVAKLAATFKLNFGLRLGLVTVDTYRIAAVEQLKTYAEIIDVPLAVANEPREMRGALDGLGTIDLALIDTAGRSPRDEVKIRELSAFLEEARPDEVHLVLSATTSRRSLGAVVEKFANVFANRLILTKLDEAETAGGVLAVVGQAGLPISYVTTGQAVPDDIEAADRDRLASLILGSEEFGEADNA